MFGAIGQGHILVAGGNGRARQVHEIRARLRGEGRADEHRIGPAASGFEGDIVVAVTCTRVGHILDQRVSSIKDAQPRAEVGRSGADHDALADAGAEGPRIAFTDGDFAGVTATVR